MNLNEIANELLHSNKVQFSGVKINELFISELIKTSSSLLTLFCRGSETPL